MVAALMREVEKDKQKELEEYEEFKAAIINELRGDVLEGKSSTHTPPTVTSAPPLKRVLKRAGTVASAVGGGVSRNDSVATESDAQQEDMAELAADRLFAKFKAMGSKVKRKSS